MRRRFVRRFSVRPVRRFQIVQNLSGEVADKRNQRELGEKVNEKADNDTGAHDDTQTQSDTAIKAVKRRKEPGIYSKPPYHFFLILNMADFTVGMRRLAVAPAPYEGHEFAAESLPFFRRQLRVLFRLRFGLGHALIDFRIDAAIVPRGACFAA